MNEKTLTYKMKKPDQEWCNVMADEIELDEDGDDYTLYDMLCDYIHSGSTFYYTDPDSEYADDDGTVMCTNPEIVQDGNVYDIVDPYTGAVIEEYMEL